MAILKEMINGHNGLSAPIISVVAGYGQIAKSAVASGADVIIALNAGLYRHLGYGSLVSFMPFRNANDQTEQLLRLHFLPHPQSDPVIAVVFASDRTQFIKLLLENLKKLGVERITNWPTIGFIDGNLISQ